VNWIEVQISKAMSAVGLSGLGVLPAVVPAVVVTAILALAYLITRWTDAATRFIERAQYVKAREADGVSPAAAINEFNAKNPVSTGLSGDIARIVWPLAIGAAALYLLKNRK
jgi:hypothetical protein